MIQFKSIMMSEHEKRGERGTKSAKGKEEGRVEINGKQPREEWPAFDLCFSMSMAMLLHRFASIPCVP